MGRLLLISSLLLLVACKQLIMLESYSDKSTREFDKNEIPENIKKDAFLYLSLRGDSVENKSWIELNDVDNHGIIKINMYDYNGDNKKSSFYTTCPPSKEILITNDYLVLGPLGAQPDLIMGGDTVSLMILDNHPLYSYYFEGSEDKIRIIDEKGQYLSTYEINSIEDKKYVLKIQSRENTLEINEFKLRGKDRLLKKDLIRYYDRVQGIIYFYDLNIEGNVIN